MRGDTALTATLHTATLQFTTLQFTTLLQSSLPKAAGECVCVNLARTGN
jgi:hypothetical protein